MGCACGKNKTRPFGPSSLKEKEAKEPKQFVLRTLKGTTVFGSRLEAEAAQRRAGGGQITAL